MRVTILEGMLCPEVMSDGQHRESRVEVVGRPCDILDFLIKFYRQETLPARRSQRFVFRKTLLPMEVVLGRRVWRRCQQLPTTVMRIISRRGSLFHLLSHHIVVTVGISWALC